MNSMEFKHENASNLKKAGACAPDAGCKGDYRSYAQKRPRG